MRVAHIVPPRWEHELPRGDYKMTFASWILDSHLEYAKGYRRGTETSYIILDTQPFERLVSPQPANTLRDVALLVDANEVILPDVLGDPEETLYLSVEALPLIASEDMCIMFVPQATTMDVWEHCLNSFLKTWQAYEDEGSLTIGLSSLRRSGSLRPQVGSRIPMMNSLWEKGLTMHLLGLASIRHFITKELPVARAVGVRGVDTCAAFTLGARGLSLTQDSPRLFLGDVWQYNSPPKGRLHLVKKNMLTLESWIKGRET